MKKGLTGKRKRGWLKRGLAVWLTAVFLLQPQYVRAEVCGESAAEGLEPGNTVPEADSGLEGPKSEIEDRKAGNTPGAEPAGPEVPGAESDPEEPGSEPPAPGEPESGVTPPAPGIPETGVMPPAPGEPESGGTPPAPGIPETGATPPAPETPDAEEEAGAAVYCAPSDGSLAGESLKFVNLYWETEDLGELEAVFDGGAGEPLVQRMERLDRGVYETHIPEGDYSRAAFRTEGSQETLLGTAYNLYGEESPEAESGTSAASYAADVNNTFYYDMGENPSYWGADPLYEPEPVSLYSASGRGIDDYEVVVNPGDMVYMIDLEKVENPEDSSLHAAKRVNIRFLAHSDGGAVSVQETFTMYEQRDGVYTAPFPQQVDQYHEISFQLVGREDLEPGGWLKRHYNFRGEADGSGSESGDDLEWGYFKYKPGYVDTFYLNLQEDKQDKDASFWGAHPSLADDSLDTQVLYVDVTDTTNNGIQVDIDGLWIGWKGMKEDLLEDTEYEEGKGYKIKDKLAQENFIYFQFPYDSGTTENTILTLTFTLEGKPDQLYTYKFTFVPRSGRNCLRIDNIWEFNGQMWTQFQVGEIDKRTIFYDNKSTEYEDGSLSVRLAQEGGTYGEWKPLEKVAVPNDYGKETLYSLEIQASYLYVQFKGTKAGKTYYSNQEEIDAKFSYPCYYAHQTGEASDSEPEGAQERPGITGYWRSVYSANTSGDESVDIPTARMEREESVYYASATFYDYYSDWEMTGRQIKEKPDDKDYKQQGNSFNDAASEYYKEEVIKKQGRSEEEQKQFKALYMTGFQGSGSWWQSGIGGQGESPNWWTGNDEKEGPVYGLADPVLTGGRITTGQTDRHPGVEMPFFNEHFLRGSNALNTAVGNVYKNVAFPFTADRDADSRTYGYWVYNSASDSDALRLSYDVDNGYFLHRTNEPIKYSSNGARSYNAFFPLNSQSDVGGPDQTRKENLNLMFGAQFNLDFALTDNAEVYNEYTQKSEPIRFEFQGDDDAWIYIDGILALDLGGIHNALRGEIDFKEGTYKIWRRLRDGNTYDGPGELLQSGKLPEALIEKLEKGGSHTLTMFYMERGLEESNLKLSFNFPRESTFSVEKEVDVEAEAKKDQENIFSELLQNMGGFNFELQNLVTSGTKLAVEESAGYLHPGKDKVLYNENTGADFAIGTVDEMKGEWPKVITQNSIVGGAEPKEEVLLRITPEQPMDLTDMSYLRLAMKNTGANDPSARNLYLSFADTEGRRVGGYANTLGWEGETNSFIKGENSVLRIAFQKMSGNSAFDWTQVERMLMGVRRTRPEDAASYEVSSIAFFESLNQVQSGGFSVTDDKISDYGSYESGTLTPVDKAWYIRKTKTGDSYDAGVSRQTDKGQFALAHGQKVIFTDKFRTGSYIALQELNVDKRIFDTQWEVLENGAPVEERYLLAARSDVKSVENPLTAVADGVLDGSGSKIGDGRKEVLDGSWPSAGAFQHPDLQQTLVYRSYLDPDVSSNVSTDVGVRVKNTLKYGSLTIQKELEEGMKDQNGNYPPGDYTFDIYYTDIAGMGLESQLSPVNGNERYVRQTVTVHVDETGKGETTVHNIPAGTDYYVVERPSNGTKLVKIKVEPAAAQSPHENVKVYDRDGQEPIDYSTARVEGTAYASDQRITFVNQREDFYMDIQKLWKDGLTDGQRGIEKIYIQLERRTYKEGQQPEEGWQVVTKEFFTDVSGDKYVILTKDNEWKIRSDKPLPNADDDGAPYEYRIVEIDKDGNLKNYEVSYNEVRNEDLPIGGKPYLHVTYQAINTSAGITVQKLWEDNDDIGGIRPTRIRVKLVGSTDKNAEENQWVCYRALLEGKKHDCSKGDCYIELNRNNAWRKAVNHLLLTNDADRTYYYKLSGEQIYSYTGSVWTWIDAEQDNSGYQVRYGEPGLPNSDTAVEISLTNTLALGNITIEKRDKEGNQILPGAEFKLERLVKGADGAEGSWEPDRAFEPRTAVTSATGTIQFKSIPYGTYRITETKAPSGYLMLKNPVHITLNDEEFAEQAKQHEGDLSYNKDKKTITVAIKNERALLIPVTGGRGAFWFTAAGAALLASSALLYWKRQERLKRRRQARRRRRK